MLLEEKKNLRDFNTFKIDAESLYFCDVKSLVDLREARDFVLENEIGRFFFLGAGANVVFKSNFYDGLVLKNSLSGVQWVSEAEVVVASGVLLDDFLMKCQGRGFFEIQGLSGIPGTVGAAVFGNVGAFGVEIRNFIKEVSVLDWESGDIFVFKSGFDFGYRSSIFKKNRKKYFILSVTFDLKKRGGKNHGYFSLSDFAKRHGFEGLRMSDLRGKILEIRSGVYPNLEKYPNVGSVFKNAEVSETIKSDLLEKFPDMPSWDLGGGKYKVSTAYLFDKALNLNGKTFGDFKVDEKRPLFIVNEGGGSGGEFWQLCRDLKKELFEKTGVEIEEEVYFVE